MDNIDIGGAAIIRAAAKNNQDVIPLIRNIDYEAILSDLRKSDGAPSGVALEVRMQLAAKAFEYIAAYDQEVGARLRSTLR